MNTEPYCWSCNRPGGNMLHFGNIHIHNTPECREIAGMQDDEPEHDGKLGEGGTVVISYQDPIYSIYGPTPGIQIKSNFGPDSIGLTPAQALSLLVWLKQQDVELQSLAYKQDALWDGNTEEKKQ